MWAPLQALTVFGGPALWFCRSAGDGFVAGRSTTGALRGCHQSLTQRRASYAFDLAQSDDHTGLEVKEKDPGTVRVLTKGSFMEGNYNTVLGDKELPASGRSYWEVKIVKKPSDAWEYIGVAEPSADLTVPLTRNKKGAGWFWGSTWTESFIYTYLPMKPEFNQAAVKKGQAVMKEFIEHFEVPEKDAAAQITPQVQNLWKGVPGTHVGQQQDNHPPFQNGMVIGVDVDMDDGSLAFWADGKYLGKVRDTEGNPVNLKGKKVVPALTVYGRTTSGGEQYTIMEVTTGLDPPPKP